MNRRMGWFWLGVVVVALLVGLVARPGRTEGMPLDPRSTTASGTQGLRELLGRFVDDVSLDPFDDDTDVVLVVEDAMLDSERGRLERFAADGGRVVVLDPSSALAPVAVTTAGSDSLTEVACSVPGLGSAGRVAGEGLLLLDIGDAVRSCFTAGSSTAAYVVQLGDASGSITALGGASPFTNQWLGEADNAVVIIGAVLGATDSDDGSSGRADLSVAIVHPATAVFDGGTDVTLFDLVPARIDVALGQLVVAAGLWLWSRGRRFGKVIVEPQLVQIPASLLVRSSAELHRRTGGHDWAQDAVRRDFDRRLRHEHRLPNELDVGYVAQMVSARTGADASALMTVLGAPAVARDADPATASSLAELVSAIDALSPLVFAQHPIQRASTPSRSSLT